MIYKFNSCLKVNNNVMLTGTVEVVDSKGTARRIIVSDDLEKPRAIALDPVVGYVTALLL